jgi:UDP-N-acetylenolpyruvoylglucosamine reductase
MSEESVETLARATIVLRHYADVITRKNLHVLYRKSCYISAKNLVLYVLRFSGAKTKQKVKNSCNKVRVTK